MKKITFLFLISSVIGFSQKLPFNFDESTDPAYYFTNFDCNFALTTDPDDAGNTVGEYTSYNYAEYGSAQTLELEENIDLSVNSVFSFRIKPKNGTGSGTHRLRFTGGTPFTEADFTTTGTDWQEVSIDLGPNLGSYRNLILFLDFGYQNFSTDVYFIDDIAGGTNVALPPTPAQSAPAPTISSDKVKSVYGETYTNLAYQYNFTDSFREVDIENNGNKALEVDLGYYGAAFSNTDVSQDLYVHFDYWTTDATQFQFRINSETPGSFERKYVVGVDEPMVNNAWTSVFIPLSHYGVGGTNPVNLQDVFQYNFVDNGNGTSGTIFIDNIYFTSETNLSIKKNDFLNFEVYPNPTTSNWKIKTANEIIASVQVFDILGKKIMTLSPNNLSVSIDANNLKAGLYFALVRTVQGKESSLKLVKN